MSHQTALPRRLTKLLLALATLFAIACGDGPTTPLGDDFTIEVVSGDGQKGLPEWTLAEQIALRVVDREGVPAAGVTIDFQVSAGGGRTSISSIVTSGLGFATVAWTLGSSAGATQTLTASVRSGSGSVQIQATLLTPAQSDLVVVHGVLGSVTGFVLFKDGPSLQVVGRQGTQDTLLYLPPAQTSGSEIVVFARGNRPLRLAPTWTAAVDTIHVTLLPPVEIDIDFHVQEGTLVDRMETMESQLATTNSIWFNQGMGLVVGTVTVIDETDPPRDVPVVSNGLCNGATSEGAIRIDHVSSIDGGQFTGWGCWNGRIYLGVGTERFPNLLAHELGHTFTLEHAATGMMFPSQPQTDIREGEIFRAHFHQQSALNTIFGAQPSEQRRNCSQVPGPCLPESLDLGSIVIALAADGSAMFEDIRFNGLGPVIDGVGREKFPGR